MFGNLSAMRRAVTQIGRRIATVIGVGFRHTAGPGSTTNPGAGQLIITDAGFMLTTIGLGRLTVNTARAEAGGSPRWSL